MTTIPYMQGKTSDVKPTSFRLKPDTHDALRRAAEDESRSISSLIEWVLRGWLEQKGYLPKRAKGSKP